MSIAATKIGQVLDVMGVYHPFDCLDIPSCQPDFFVLTNVSSVWVIDFRFNFILVDWVDVRAGNGGMYLVKEDAKVLVGS